MSEVHCKTYDTIESIDMGDFLGIDAQSQLRFMRDLQLEATHKGDLGLIVKIQQMIMRALKDYGLYPKRKKAKETLEETSQEAVPEQQMEKKKMSPTERVQAAAEALHRAMVAKGFRRDWQKALAKKLEKHFGRKFDRRNPPTTEENVEPDPAEWDFEDLNLSSAAA